MNLRNAMMARCERTCWGVGLFCESDGAGVGLNGARENIHQRTFTSAVLANQRVDLTFEQLKIYLVQCNCGGILLADVVELNQGHQVLLLRPVRLATATINSIGSTGFARCIDRKSVV